MKSLLSVLAVGQRGREIGTGTVLITSTDSADSQIYRKLYRFFALKERYPLRGINKMLM